MADPLLDLLVEREIERTTQNDDPVIRRALKILGQPVNPVRVVTPKDYGDIDLPPALHDQASKAVGFRVWRGVTPDEPIYVNKQSTVYSNASDPRSGNLEALLLASTLAHEMTHDSEHGEIGEGAALRIQSDFIRDKLKTMKTAADRRAAQNYLKVIDERAAQRLNRK